MDGKGRATDNAWIERFWKSLKYNYVYLNPCDSGLELFEGVQRYIEYYHRKRHQTIKMSPNTTYDQSMRNKGSMNEKINLANEPFGPSNGEYYAPIAEY